MKPSFAWLRGARPHLLTALAAAALTAALLPSQVRAAGPAPMKIAVVDMRRAVMETEDGLRAQSTLRKFFDRRQTELNARQEELVRKKEDLEKQSKVLSQAALQRALEDWQKQMGELQATYTDYDREMQKRQGEITAPIFAKVGGLLRKVAQRDGYDVVLEKQAVPYSRADLDVTDAVIMMYNGGEEPAPDAAGAAPAGSAPAAGRSAAPPAAPASGAAPAPAPPAPSGKAP
jgi:outer membrane protein